MEKKKKRRGSRTPIFDDRNKIKEGDIVCKWFDNRLLKRNQNVLIVTTGGTGSGKSYCNLRIVELWYKKRWKRNYPIDNICFSISDVIKRLNSGKLRRGELLIFEEAGVNLGSLDFQNKVSKLFTYVLQSFRSMNIGILFNLPHIQMLNKTARMLVHAHFETAGIERGKKMIRIKPLFHQVNQYDGKIYRKYMKIRLEGRNTKVKKFWFGLPTKKLREAYEKQKHKFLSNFTEEFEKKLNEAEKDKQRKMWRRNLTNSQMELLEMAQKGMSVKEIAEERGVSKTSIYESLGAIRKKGYETNIRKKNRKYPKENQVFKGNI